MASQDLYSLVEKGVAVRDRDHVQLDAHARITTNTYFGRFPARYWQRWTAVRAVDLDAVVTGTGLLRIVASDRGGHPRTVTTREVVDARNEPVRLNVAVDRFVDGGALWLELETGRGELIVESVGWSVPSSRGARPTAVVICPF